jgi:hypothetical protein
MDATKAHDVVRITLTTAQAQEVKAATGRDAEAIELTIYELEERIAPRLASNSNESLIVC